MKKIIRGLMCSQFLAQKGGHLHFSGGHLAYTHPPTMIYFAKKYMTHFTPHYPILFVLNGSATLHGKGSKFVPKDLFDLFQLPVYKIIQPYKWSPGC
jgi:hypothetical protein